MEPLVSITTPTYNRADGHLRDALESALAQTYENIEIVVSDNCSTDNTQEVVSSYDDPRIRYHRQVTNLGYLGNFNFCVEAAKGELFLMLHDDDMIDPDFVSTCVERARGHDDIGVVHTGVRLIDGNGGLIKEVSNKAVGNEIDDLVHSWFSGAKPLYLCNTLFGTRWLKERGGFHSEYNLYLDVFAQLDLAAHHGWIDIPDVKASVRRHADEITHLSKITPWAKESLLLLDYICELVPSDREDAIRREGAHWFVRRNYDLAKKADGWWKRTQGLIAVWRTFGLNYPPSRRLLRSHFRDLLGGAVQA